LSLALTECSMDNACQGECANINGTDECYCPSNFEVDPNDSTACKGE